jgi:hypothetical protein
MPARTGEQAEGFPALAVAEEIVFPPERAEGFPAGASLEYPLDHGERAEDSFLTLVEYGAGVLRKPNGSTTGPDSSKTLAETRHREPP